VITPYNPSRGIDLYVDAAGEDDWQVGMDKYYLFGQMVCGASPEWIQWMTTHKTEYGGMVHWSAGKFGKQRLSLPNKKRKCRELLATHPWLKTSIYAFDKESFYNALPVNATKRLVVQRLWHIFTIHFLGTVMPHIKNLVPDDQWGCLNIRNVIINNPKVADKGLIETVVKKEFGRVPKFVSAGHYGIDALDGVLWAFYRYLNLGRGDCIPDTASDFSKDLDVVIIGIKSEKPVMLRNTGDIDLFKSTA
jgi:hypothetical protein